MLFSTPLALLMALAPTALIAAPTGTVNTKAVLEMRQYKLPETTQCDLNAAVMPTAPSPLPAPSGQLVHVAVGRGTQNYTCAATPNDSKSAPKAIGAIATLYNVTCLTVIAPDVLKDVPSIALSLPLTSKRSVTLDNNINDGPVSGHHSFTASGSPLFMTEYGWAQAKAAANSTAPTNSVKGKNGLGAVPWLKLTATQGDFKEVYRLETAGGKAPDTCADEAGAFEVQYAALYWFFK